MKRSLSLLCGTLLFAGCARSVKSLGEDNAGVAQVVDPKASLGKPKPRAQRVEQIKAHGQLGPGRGTLVISLEAPPGAKLTKGSPLSASASGEHLRFGKRIRTRLDPAQLPLRLPVDVADGATGPALVELSYVWCTEGKRGACNPEHVRVSVDLDLNGDAPGGEAYFTHQPRPR